MNMYASLSLLASYACFLFGVLIYQKDPKNELNKIFALLCISLGCITFGEFGARYAEDAAAAFPWVKLGSIWPFTMALLLHFVFVFTKKLFKSNLTYVLLYTPACIFFLIDITTNLLSEELIKEYWGWTYSAPGNLFVYISSIWAFLLAALSVILCFLYFYRARGSERQCAKYVFIWVSIPVVAGIITEQIFPVTSIKVPELGFTASALGVVFIQYAMVKYKLFSLTPAVAAEDMIAAMSNFLFLAEEDGTISLANQSALQLLGYYESELMGQPLKRVFAQKEWEIIEEKLHNMDEPYLISGETYIVTKEEKVIPVLLSISVVQDKEGNNLGMACVGSDLTDQKKAEKTQRREVLLKEIHHRVKNNMQIISSLLSLQSRYFNDEQDKKMIKESQNRIKSMALVHEKLYQSSDLEHINFCEYITDVVHRLILPYRVHVTAVLDVDAVAFGMDTALPCGLIINELVSNSLIHAFPDKKGEICVALHVADGIVSLTVKDNGVGIPDTINFRTAQTLGLRLVTFLVEDQLNGTIELANNEGTTFCIQFRTK